MLPFGSQEENPFGGFRLEVQDVWAKEHMTYCLLMINYSVFNNFMGSAFTHTIIKPGSVHLSHPTFWSTAHLSPFIDPVLTQRHGTVRGGGLKS